MECCEQKKKHMNDNVTQEHCDLKHDSKSYFSEGGERGGRGGRKKVDSFWILFLEASFFFRSGKPFGLLFNFPRRISNLILFFVEAWRIYRKNTEETMNTSSHFDISSRFDEEVESNKRSGRTAF